MLTLKIPHQSKWLVLQFYKCVDPRLGIMVPDELIIPKVYFITWNSFCKKVINQKINKSKKVINQKVLLFKYSYNKKSRLKYWGSSQKFQRESPDVLSSPTYLCKSSISRDFNAVRRLSFGCEGSVWYY